jgi:phosphate transport system protein
MTTSPSIFSDAVMYDTLVNYLVSMARTVEGAMNRALDAIVSLETPRTVALPSEVFLLEPRINEMEIVIDEHAIRLLRQGSFTDDELRLIVAALKITNDLERIGDIAVNLAQRVVSLRDMPGAQVPEELAPMASAVRAMVSQSLGALIFRNVDMATKVLESDDLVDQYRDRIFEQLLQRMTQDTQVVSPGLQFILATRHLERIADHATNIAEDIIFWVRGLDVRHGRGLVAVAELAEGPAEGPAEDSAEGRAEATAEDTARNTVEAGDEVTAGKATSSRRAPNEVAETADDWTTQPEGVTDNLHALHSHVTGACETERA